MYDRSNTGAAANYYKQGTQNANGSSTMQRRSQNMFAPYDYNKSLTTNPKTNPTGSVNTSQSFTPYGQSDRRGAAHQSHQIYNPITGDGSNPRGGRNTLQNNASLIMNQNGTASSSNINMASPNTTKSSNEMQQPLSDSFRQRHGNLYDRGGRANNIVSGSGAANNAAAHEYYQSSAPPGMVNERTKPKVNLRGQSDPQARGGGLHDYNNQNNDPYSNSGNSSSMQRDRMNQRLQKIREDVG